MFKTIFGTIDSYSMLGLIQQKVEIGPALPKTSFVDIPGANGSKDLTEALGVGVRYKDRTIKWTFALYPGDDWPAKISEVSNALNGKRMEIKLDGDTMHYLGRVSVDSHKSDKLLRQITVSAVCEPYKVSSTAKTQTENITTSYKLVNVVIGDLPQVPTVTVSRETVFKVGTFEKTVAAGTHTIPELYASGTATYQVKTTASTGTVTFSWTEGSL